MPVEPVRGARKRSGHDDEARRMFQMERWLDAMCAEIGSDRAIVDAHRDELLNLVSTVAHGPSRPAAPMTAFIIGWAAASTGEDVSGLVARAEALAARWQADR